MNEDLIQYNDDDTVNVPFGLGMLDCLSSSVRVLNPIKLIEIQLQTDLHKPDFKSFLKLCL